MDNCRPLYFLVFLLIKILYTTLPCPLKFSGSFCLPVWYPCFFFFRNLSSASRDSWIIIPDLFSPWLTQKHTVYLLLWHLSRNLNEFCILSKDFLLHLFPYFTAWLFYNYFLLQYLFPLLPFPAHLSKSLLFCHRSRVYRMRPEKCQSKVEKCSRLSCPTTVNDPVCGTDGTTYLNFCLLHVATCLCVLSPCYTALSHTLTL